MPRTDSGVAVDSKICAAGGQQREALRARLWTRWRPWRRYFFFAAFAGCFFLARAAPGLF
jgi:hypothetical protein